MSETPETIEQILARLFNEPRPYEWEGFEARMRLRAAGLVVVETLDAVRPPLKDALRQLAVLVPGAPATSVPKWMRDNNWGATINALCAEALARIEELEAKAANDKPLPSADIDGKPGTVIKNAGKYTL